MLSIRKGGIGILGDLDFLVEVDLQNEGYTVLDNIQITPSELQQHRNKIASFLTHEDKGVFIAEDESEHSQVATIMYRIRNRNTIQHHEVFNKLDRSLFPPDGRFLEVFQLWVDPSYRRRGLATKLKRKLEEEAIKLIISLIYTHTEETNLVAIHLNERLGYHEIRRGSIWDKVVRVSLIKEL